MEISPWLQLGTSTFLSLDKGNDPWLTVSLLKQINEITYISIHIIEEVIQ